MSKQKIKTRVQNKHDVAANWSKATSFIPLAGELIIYDEDSTYSYKRFKIGDGVLQSDGTVVGTTVNDLPFLHTLRSDGDITVNATTGAVSVKDDSHTHDGRYYTESEINTKLNGVNANLAGHTHTVSHTPAGTVSTPTITVTPNTTTVNSITAVGTLPSLTYEEVAADNITAWSAGSGSASLTGSVSTGPNRKVTLTLSHTHTAPTLTYSEVKPHKITAWSAGTLPTKGSNTTVATGIKSATSTQPTFTGTTATLTTGAASY